MDTGEETAEFIIASLDAYYPNKDRADIPVLDKMFMYYDTKKEYIILKNTIKDMVGNG